MSGEWFQFVLNPLPISGWALSRPDPGLAVQQRWSVIRRVRPRRAWGKPPLNGHLVHPQGRYLYAHLWRGNCGSENPLTCLAQGHEAGKQEVGSHPCGLRDEVLAIWVGATRSPPLRLSPLPAALSCSAGLQCAWVFPPGAWGWGKLPQKENIHHQDVVEW